MNERCQVCGAELYAGQQFCRSCGTPVGQRGAGEEAPTRLLPPDSPTGGVAANATSPLPGRGTDPVGGRQPHGFQPSYPSSFPATPPAPVARAASRRTWVVLLIIAVVTFAGLGTLSFVKSLFGGGPKVIVKKTGKPDAPPAPVAPVVPDVPELPVIPGVEAGVGGEILDDEGASVTAQETVITKTFALDDDATFSVKNVDGDVSVEGWDQDRAEVKVVKHGGSADQRRAAHVVLANAGGQFHLVTAALPGGPVEVRYEVKLPRGLGKLDISAGRGDVKVKEFDGPVAVSLREGDIEIAAGGAVTSKLVNGSTKIAYVGSHDEAQEFSVVNGDVEVSFGGKPEADVKAQTTSGDIKVDDALGGVKAEKKAAGYRLDAELGGGGGPLTIKVVNGDIKLKP